MSPARRMKSADWDDLPRLLQRVGDLLVELHFVDAAIEHFGPDLVLGQGDATATYTVTLGWTHPYAHTFVRPVISLGGSGDRAADVRRELDDLVATSRAWGSAQVADFVPGLQSLVTPDPDALAAAAVTLGSIGDLLGGSVDTDLASLNASLSHWYGDAKDGFVELSGGLSTSRELQAELAATIGVASAGAVVAVCTARTSVVHLLVETARRLDLQLQERANRQTQTTLDVLRIAAPASSSIFSLVSLVPGGAVLGGIAAGISSILGLVVDQLPDTETVDLPISSAPTAVGLLHSVRSRILDNRDTQLDEAREQTTGRIQRVLDAGGYATLTPPRPELADHPVDADSFHHSSSESY
ncbi:hypothetical protein EUA93_20875 [Nocardioides oleivorans]|uniref:Uncharacterized protein n=1 Tax=Nocardioides oleivorans TaxID=273676 RepID=A0A4Q2RQM6_9ACTN|nr:hypothetical protein [Nocardioides oleivorans]RYB90009.1 hypothetical protein EUA93_20875 [Nocardioides oleivorans]